MVSQGQVLQSFSSHTLLSTCFWLCQQSGAGGACLNAALLTPVGMQCSHGLLLRLRRGDMARLGDGWTQRWEGLASTTAALAARLDALEARRCWRMPMQAPFHHAPKRVVLTGKCKHEPVCRLANRLHLFSIADIRWSIT